MAIHFLPVRVPTQMREREARFQAMMILRDADSALHIFTMALRYGQTPWNEVLAVLLEELERRHRDAA